MVSVRYFMSNFHCLSNHKFQEGGPYLRASPLECSLQHTHGFFCTNSPGLTVPAVPQHGWTCGEDHGLPQLGPPRTALDGLLTAKPAPASHYGSHTRAQNANTGRSGSCQSFKTEAGKEPPLSCQHSAGIRHLSETPWSHLCMKNLRPTSLFLRGQAKLSILCFSC